MMKLFQSHFDGRMHVLEIPQHLWRTFDTSFSCSCRWNHHADASRDSKFVRLTLHSGHLHKRKLRSSRL